MFDALLLNDNESKDSFMSSQLFYDDVSGALKTNSPISGVPLNNGLIWRYNLTSPGTPVEMEGPLYVDVCQQDRLILNGVPLNIKCWPSKPNFCLIGSEADGGYRVVITSACIKLCCVKVHPGVILGHNEALTKSPALYPYSKSIIKTFSVAANQYNFSTDDLFQGEIPQNVMVAMVPGKAYSADMSTNPYFFHHYNCNSIGFYVDGQSVPERVLEPNFETKEYLSAYLRLSEFPGRAIDRKGFALGYTIFNFPLSKKINSQHMDVVRKGHTRLEIGFAKKLEETIVVIVYAKFSSLLTIDATRNVRV